MVIEKSVFATHQTELNFLFVFVSLLRKFIAFTWG